MDHNAFHNPGNDIVGAIIDTFALQLSNHDEPPMICYLPGTFIRVIYIRNILNYTTLEGYMYPSRVGICRLRVEYHFLV